MDMDEPYIIYRSLIDKFITTRVSVIPIVLENEQGENV
jgi:hypothetical protein